MILDIRNPGNLRVSRPGVQIWTGNPLRKGGPRRELNPSANWFASTSIFRKGIPVFCSLERHELIPTDCPTPEYAFSWGRSRNLKIQLAKSPKWTIARARSSRRLCIRREKTSRLPSWGLLAVSICLRHGPTRTGARGARSPSRFVAVAKNHDLFVSQRHDRIYAHCTPRGNVARHQRDAQQK